MYELFLDKKEIFECKIKLEGASLKDSRARIILETQDLNILFNGDISSNGVCKIPIKKLKNLFDEGTTGNMVLEVIADDTHFQPWKSEFIIKTSKKIQVEVLSNTPQKDDKKVIVEVKTKKQLNEFKHLIKINKPQEIKSPRVKKQIEDFVKQGIQSKEIGIEMGFVTTDTKGVTDEFQKIKNKVYFELKNIKENIKHVSTISEYLKSKKINRKNIAENKKEILPIIKEYAKRTNIKNYNLFLKEIIRKL